MEVTDNHSQFTTLKLWQKKYGTICESRTTQSRNVKKSVFF